MSRPTCPRCRRPLRTCLCDLVRPVHPRTRVLVLQHPEEAGQAKGSAGLLALSLRGCDVATAERFAPDALHDLLHADGRQPWLLYPPDNPPGTPAPAAAVPPPPEQLRLVVLDATWRKSRRMLLDHPQLAGLPRLGLAAPPPSRYAPLRKARRPDSQRSTLEATCLALCDLEAEPVPTQCRQLLEAFTQWVGRSCGFRDGGAAP